MASTDGNSLLTERPLVRCEHRYGVMICLQCGSAFPKTRMAVHFRVYHHYRFDVYRSILESIKREGTDALVECWKDLQYPQDRSPPTEGLKIHNGFACTGCGTKTTNNKIAKDHFKCAGNVIEARLQCWNIARAQRYGTVSASDGLLPPTATNPVSSML